jgi:hypothetical protein
MKKSVFLASKQAKYNVLARKCSIEISVQSSKKDDTTCTNKQN